MTTMLKVCDEAMATAAVCRNILFLLCGYNKAEMNSTVRPSAKLYYTSFQ